MLQRDIGKSQILTNGKTSYTSMELTFDIFRVWSVMRHLQSWVNFQCLSTMQVCLHSENELFS